MPENQKPKSVRKILKNLRNFADVLHQPKLKQRANNISSTKTSSSTNLKKKKIKTNKKPMRLCVCVCDPRRRRSVCNGIICTIYNRSYHSGCQLGLSLTKKNFRDKPDKDCNKIFICSRIKKEIKFINKAHQTIFKHLIKVAYVAIVRLFLNLCWANV